MPSGLNEQLTAHMSLKSIKINVQSTLLARGKALAQEAWKETFKRSY